jgi:hypothetical protein
MKRSFGVTFSAVFVLMGSVASLCLATLFALFLMLTPQGKQMPAPARTFVAVWILFWVAADGWGIATGVGLLRLREWARISMLVFSVILLLFSLPSALVFALMPMAHVTNLPNNVALPPSAIFITLSAFWGFFAVLGAGWIYFFNRRSVRDEFRGTGMPAGSVAPEPARPLSITIIGWWLLISGSLGTIFLLILRLGHFAFRQIPIPVLGFPLTGWPATLFGLFQSVANIVAGMGLLKLKPWGRILAIWVFVFAVINALMTLLPGRLANYQQAMNLALGRQSPPAFSPWLRSIFGLAIGLLIIAIQLWFVITRKQAFGNSPGISALKDGFDPPAAGQ